MARLIVSNTGPIITLEKLSDGFDFIRKLYDSVLLPTEVLRELAEGTHLVHSTYLRSYKIDDLVQVGRVTRILDVPGMNKLDKGEQEAISLALI